MPARISLCSFSAFSFRFTETDVTASSFDPKINSAASIKASPKRQCVTITIPGVSNNLFYKLEGNSPTIKERLKTVKIIKKNKIAVGVAISPIIPYVSDEKELEKILKKIAATGSDYVLFSPLIIKIYNGNIIKYLQ